MGAHSENSRRIVKNTLMLYVRMLFLMLIGFYTSRVVLGALGETDFGIYNVVGGVVAMFTVVSGTLNAAISRFITFELGKGGGMHLNKVYSTAVLIQALIAIIVAVVAEPVGMWFINNEMTIAPERIPAARWVLHFSIFSFVINLLSVPQMASITAHEHMSAYAYIGLSDGLLRLAVALLLQHSPIDRLVYYSALMAVAVTIVRITYGIYCRRHFEECRFRPVFDKGLVKEMFSFAGWNFIGASSGVLRDHGGNILVNIFFGPAMNAARGVAVQVFSALQGFVTNFMTAVNPQITKSYASGDKEFMLSLVRKSSRMSFYLLSIIALPVIFNADFLLGIWLKDVPDNASDFVRLFLIFALSESLSHSLVTAQLATGNIKKYQIIVGGIIMLNLPVSYILLKAGFPAESTVIVAIVISQLSFFARLFLLKGMVGLSVKTFLHKVYLNVIAVTAAALIAPLMFEMIKPSGVAGFVSGILICLCSVSASVLFVGCSKAERKDMLMLVIRKLRK